MWLTGRLTPDFKTIADFRRDNGTGIRNICRRFMTLCRTLRHGCAPDHSERQSSAHAHVVQRAGHQSARRYFVSGFVNKYSRRIAAQGLPASAWLPH
jgi:hypothetical protein